MNKWNSSFRVTENRLRRSEFKRVPGTARLKAGPKTKKWAAVRAQLKRQFAAKGITTCEVRISEHCTPDDFLSMAHSKKRRFCSTEKDLREVVIACFACHQVLDEVMTHEEMYKTVREVIERRTNEYY